MAQLIEFVGNHWILATLWVGFVLALALHRSKSSGEALSCQQAVMMINRSDAVLLDIREKKEFDAGHIVDSVHIPMAKLAANVAELDKYKARPIIVACKLGQTSADAVKILKSAGFQQVMRLSGGITEWRADNLPLVQK